MKFKCSGLDLFDAATKVVKAVAVKNNNSILEGIKLSVENNVLTLNATDLELSIEKRLKADVTIEGEIVVPGKIFVELVRKLVNETIEFNLQDKNQLKIVYGNNVGYLQCFNALEFPGFKKIEDSDYFEIKQNDFKVLIGKSIISAATDDSRPILKGCLFEVERKNIRSVALDGYRLAVVNKKLINSTAELNAVVPARSLLEISKLLSDSDDPVKVYIQKNYLMCDLKETVILTRLLDGDFINYRKIIPASQSSLMTINKRQFEEALERASLLSRIDRNNIVKFDISSDIMVITSNSEAGEICEKINIQSENMKLKIAFNAKYLIEVLQAQEDEFVKVSFETGLEPCVIRPNIGEQYLYLILPVRLPN